MIPRNKRIGVQNTLHHVTAWFPRCWCAHRTVQTGECLTPQVWVVWLVSSTFLAPMQLLVVLVETTCHIINANVCFLFKKINKSGIFVATVTEFGSLHPWCCLLLWSVIWAHRAELVYLDTILSYSVRRQNVQPSLPCCVQPLLSCFFFFAYKDFSTLISRLLWGPNSAPRLTLLTKMLMFRFEFPFYSPPSQLQMWIRHPSRLFEMW